MCYAVNGTIRFEYLGNNGLLWNIHSSEKIVIPIIV